MTKDKVLYQFFNEFMPAYPETAVPDDMVFPWMTYQINYGRQADGTLHLWYHTDSEATPNAKAEEICNRLRNGGVILPYDGGGMWIHLGQPEWYATQDQGNNTTKHRIINIVIETVGD